MHHLFIINPKAGKSKKYKSLIDDINLYANDIKDFTYDIVLTKMPLNATTVAQQYSKKYSDGLKIYSAGGDGTLNEVVRGVLAAKDISNISIGVFPIGNGNDFSRNTSSRSAMDVLAQINAKEILVDIMSININNRETFGINAITTGWDSEIAIDVHKRRDNRLITGTPSYVFSLLKGLSKIKHTKALNITLDDEVINGDFILALAANGKYYGGGFQGAPLAKIDDGLAEIMLVKQIPYRKLLPLLLKYAKGEHLNKENEQKFKDYIVYKKSSYVKMESKDLLPITIDGEGEYTNTYTLSMMPKKLKFLVP